MAADTLDILTKKEYINKDGETISLESEMAFNKSHTEFYSSSDLEKVSLNQKNDSKFDTKFEVFNLTTLSAILKVCNEEENEKIMCLNFASAKNPGGGFMNGAEAQEESLARTSGLYLSQLECKQFYETHRSMKSCAYTDAMIYSPQTPVFRMDNGELLKRPVFCNFITSAAVNAGVLKSNEPELVHMIEALMFQRIDKLLSLALLKNNEVLILGAWGCGVFRNDPKMIASLFDKLLKGKFKNAFRRVVFAVFTKDENVLQLFEAII